MDENDTTPEDEYELADNYPIPEVPKPKFEFTPTSKVPKPIRKVEVPIFKKKTGFMQLFKKKAKKDDFHEPILILMRESGEDDILEGVSEGKLSIKKKDGKDRLIYIDNAKMRSLNYGGESLKYYIGKESEATLYPLDTVHDSRSLLVYVKKIIFDRQELESTGFKFDPLVITFVVLAVIAIVGYFAFRNGWFAGLFGGS